MNSVHVPKLLNKWMNWLRRTHCALCMWWFDQNQRNQWINIKYVVTNTQEDATLAFIYHVFSKHVPV